MATLEGKHTLYDAAELLQSLGASEALNLDGGGSTTMIVRGQTVTRNRRGSQRCVATALAIVDKQSLLTCRQKTTYVPSCNLVDFAAEAKSDDVLLATTNDSVLLSTTSYTPSISLFVSWTPPQHEFIALRLKVDIVCPEPTQDAILTTNNKKKPKRR
jgi:hypothetical protein